MASSGSVQLSEQLYHRLHNSRTVCKSCPVSAQSGPTVSGPRANSRHDVRRSSIDQAEGLGHQRRNPECCEGRAGVRARVRLDGRDGGGTIHQIWNKRPQKARCLSSSTPVGPRSSCCQGWGPGVQTGFFFAGMPKYSLRKPIRFPKIITTNEILEFFSSGSLSRFGCSARTHHS